MRSNPAGFFDTTTGSNDRSAAGDVPSITHAAVISALE